jgi:rare lipoprotein A (peptidoglycan hydrolase)
MIIGRGIFKSLLIVSALTLPACSIVPKGHGDFDAGYREWGQASWYGGEFHGRLTASGDVYDQHGMTSAHRALPLGSLVRVTNVENGHAVDVVINDRGPFVDGRIIDLSLAAAERLGMVEAGTSPVWIEVIRHGNGAARAGSPKTELRAHAFSPVLMAEPGSRYGDAWIVPAGTEASRLSRRPIDAYRDERRSRRLPEQAPEEPLTLP